MDKCSKILDSYLQPVLDIWGQKQEQTRCHITGDCMAPLIRDGDTLIIKHGNNDVHAGDVVVYGEPGKFFVHRIIRVRINDRKKSYVLKPDRYFSITEDVDEEKIMGKVTRVDGTSGSFRFTSLFWKCINPIMAMTFFSFWRSSQRDSVFWKTVNNFLVIWQKISPFRYPVTVNFLRIIYHTNRLWGRIRPFKSKQK